MMDAGPGDGHQMDCIALASFTRTLNDPPPDKTSEREGGLYSGRLRSRLAFAEFLLFLLEIRRERFGIELFSSRLLGQFIPTQFTSGFEDFFFHECADVLV